MKQPLWILTSTLLLVLIISIGLSVLLKQEPPKQRKKGLHTEEIEDEKKETVINNENIYKYDIFDTYVSKEKGPTKKSLLSPIPELQIPDIPKPKQPEKPKILPPLKATLKGTVLSTNEQKSIAMMTDETNKEAIYHVGEKIKDAQLIKVTKNRVVVIRSNGQHETIYLRKDDFKPEIARKPSLEEIVKKLEENKYKVDPKNFTTEIDSIGMLSEKLSLITSYKKGKPLGIKIGKLPEKTIGLAMGLQQGDIVTKINAIETTDRKNKMKIYDTITNLDDGKTIDIAIQRNGQDVALTYKLGKIEKPTKKQFTGKEQDKDKEAAFKLSKLQEREKRIRDFSKRHNTQRESTMNEIRQRLLQNMKTRSKNVRVR